MQASPTTIFLKSPEVRDLHWVLRSPGLLDPSSSEFQGRILPDSDALGLCPDFDSKLQAFATDPSELLHALESEPLSTQRVGRAFESLLKFWLRQFVRPQRLETGKTLKLGRRVVGEMDFLFTLPDGRSEHWETSVKFYLYVGKGRDEINDLSRYVGTEVEDRLDRKLNRLLEHQLAIPHRPEIALALREEGYTDIRSRAWVKGVIFYPREAWNELPTPQGISPEHSRGWWIRSSELGLLRNQASEQETRWVILPKSRWLSPFQSDHDTGLSTPEILKTLEEHFSRSSAALMLAQLSPSPLNGWQESQRGVVVSQDFLTL